MSEPRVAFVIHSLVVGGAEKFFISLVNHFYRSGHNPLVILLSDDNELFPEMDAGVNSVIIKRKFKYDLTVGRKIRAELKKHDIDTVFCVNIFSFFLLKLFYPFNRRVRFFLSLHSTIPATTKEHLMNYAYFRSVSSRDKVLFICEAQKEYLGSRYFFHPAQSNVIYNGINTDYFTVRNEAALAVRRQLRQQMGISENEPVIVKVARLFHEKGHAYAVDALEILHNRLGRKAHLLFVGSGDADYTKYVKEYVAKSPVSAYIHFVDHQKDVRPYHHMSDLFTLTSHKIETFSLAALEAMSSGIPCSLTRIGGAAEMITEQTGALSESKNPASIAASWDQVLQRSYAPEALHRFVVDRFAIGDMITHYRKELLPGEQAIPLPDPVLAQKPMYNL